MTTEESYEIEYYNSLSVALEDSLPVENFKYDKGHSSQAIKKIRKFFKNHERYMATLQFDTGRKITEPILGCIVEIHPSGVVFASRCYDPDGNFRQFLSYFVSYVDIYCNLAIVRVFGDI